MAYLLKTFTDGTNTAVQTMAAEMTSWFAANPGRLVDVTTSRKSSQRSNGILIARVLVQTGVPAPVYTAASILGTDTRSLPDAYAAYLTLNPDYVLVRAVRADATQTRTISRGALLGIFAMTSAPESTMPYAASPASSIAAGASGSCSLIDGAGVVVATVSVTNIGSTTWNAGQRSVATYLQSLSAWIGVAPS
jgi:hypothetical protein